MVDRLVIEKKRAEEYSVLVTRAVKAVQDRLRQKGLSQDSGMISPADSSILNFKMSANYETGVTAFELSFAGAFNEGEMSYVFEDGKVRKQGHTYTDDDSVHDGERYYGHFTEEDKEFFAGDNPDDPEAIPRDDVFFEDPLPVGATELRMVSQIIDSLDVNPKKADKLAHKLPWFE